MDSASAACSARIKVRGVRDHDAPAVLFIHMAVPVACRISLVQAQKKKRKSHTKQWSKPLLWLHTSRVREVRHHSGRATPYSRLTANGQQGPTDAPRRR